MLRLINADDIGLEWDRVRAGLVEVKKETTDDWLPEDVYMSLKMGCSSLYIGENEGEYVGFLVLRLISDFHHKRIEIWAAYSATTQPLMKLFWPQIQAIAKEVQASRISFLSARNWDGGAKMLGFTPKQTVYEFNL